jgi:hypothetical protein
MGARKASAVAVSLVDDAALDELFHQHGHQSIGYGKHKSLSRRPTTTGGAFAGSLTSQPGKTAIFNKSLQNLAAEEVERLKEIIASKDDMITKLSRKLSHVRAYPLKGLGGGRMGGDSSDDERGLYSEEQKAAGAGKSVQFDARVIKTHTTLGGEDDESESESFKAEEDEFQRRRVEDALALQRHFSASGRKARAAQPAHIRAIRESKSFKERPGWEM